jgi:hypothetical protein
LVYQKTTDSFKAKLNKEYGLLEKYIKKLGRNFSMRDGVYSEQYDIYDNALSNDTLLRRGRSIDEVINDLNYIMGKLERITQKELDAMFQEQPSKKKTHDYVDRKRIEELMSIKNNNFDFTILIELCEELNLVFENRCYLLVAISVRAILDHVPPIFKKKNFSEVVNNYSWSTSHKKTIERLDKSCRDIADSFLHVHIRSKESLPNSTQVNFKNELDVLLSEVCRITK